MRSPAERYLRSLLLEGRSVDDVVAIASQKQLDVPSPDYVEQLRRGVESYSPFDPVSRRAQLFVLREGVRPYFFRDSDVDVALGLLDLPRAKAAIETALIAQLGARWIVSALRRDGNHVSERSVDLFRWFYFDLHLVDASELQALLARRVLQDPFLAKEHRRDARVLAAQVPAPSLAALLTTLRRGHRPTGFELSRVLDAARTAASVETLNATLRDEPTRAARYATVARMTHEMLVDLGDEQEALRSQLAAIIIETDPEGPPTIAELSGGAHTTQLEPETDS